MPMNDLLPVRRDDLVVGVPVAFPVYDAQGKLLLNVGQVVYSEKQVDTLFERGLFCNPAWQGSNQPERVSRIQVGTDAAPVVEVGRGAMRSATLPRDDGKFSFDRLRLLPGTILQVHSATDDSRARASHKLIGWQEKAGILLSALNAQGNIAPFREGELLAVRLMAGKEIVAFQSEVRKICFSPFPYVHLSWPEILQRQMLRKSMRVNTQLIVRITAGGGARRYSGRVINLSVGGAQLMVPDASLNREDEIQLALRLMAAGQEHLLTLGARVRSVNVEPMPDAVQSVRYGLEFLPMGTPEQLVLENYILNNLAEV